MGDSTCQLLDALLAIAQKAGIPPSVYAIEECAELTQALMKDRRGKGDPEKIIDEACDVLNTVGILLRQYGVSQEEAEERMRAKCRRAVERWEKGRQV